MGYLKDIHGMTLIGRVPEGTCVECAVKHDPKQPHNRDSLTYQYKFYDQHGRWPTWEDAMAHCPEEVKEFWVQALRERGVTVKNYDFWKEKRYASFTWKSDIYVYSCNTHKWK